nr:alpha/beta hydrolase [Mycolicibacterium holsaticum]
MVFDGIVETAWVSGPSHGSPVVLLTRLPSPLDAVCQRLRIADLRTVVIDIDDRMTVDTVVGILDAIGVKCAVLAGDRGGGELAWRLAAARPDRFTGLVVIDVGHPEVAGRPCFAHGVPCPPINVNTTAIVSNSDALDAVHASGRYICGDFRLVRSSRHAPHFIAQVASEIVLRSAVW